MIQNKINDSEIINKDLNKSNNNLILGQKNIINNEVISNKNNISELSNKNENIDFVNSLKPIIHIQSKIKEELRNTLIDSTNEFENEDEINYFSYIKSYFCCICSDKILKNKYNYEFGRVKKILDFKIFTNYLMDSYLN